MNPPQADHEYGRPSLRAVSSTSRKPCVLGCSFNRLPATALGTGRTSSPCDVPFRYASASILDFGFLNTNVDIKLNSSDFAIGSRVLTSFSANFRCAFRNRQSGGPPASPERSRWRAGTPIFAVSSQQFMKHPGWLSPSSLWHHVCIKIPMRWAGSSPIPFP